MDPLAGLLDGPRASGAFVLRCSLDPPWGLRIEDEAPLTLLVPLRGDVWVMPDGRAASKLGPRDVGLLRGPGHYTVADDTATPPDVFVGADGRCRSLEGRELEESMALGVRFWGTNPEGASSMLIGTYAISGDIGGRLLNALPGVATIAAAGWDSRLTDLVAEEILRDEPGQESVIDRLLDLLLVTALRAWFTRPGAGAPGWIRAQSEPSVAHALRLMQHNPRHPWTVGELAERVGLSRAAFSRRFSELVGEPPMAYLTSWRLDLAADLLLEPGATVGSVADQVGYGSSFALSSAFKRERGLSPKQHRLARLHADAALAPDGQAPAAQGSAPARRRVAADATHPDPAPEEEDRGARRQPLEVQAGDEARRA